MSVRGVRLFGVMVLWLLCCGVQGQTVVPDVIIQDTAVTRKQYEESNRFYDKLRERSEDSRLARRLYRALLSDEDRQLTPADLETSLEKEVTYFREYEGKRINSINIYRNTIFSDEYPARDFRTLANALHPVTRESKIWRNVLFRVGQTVDPGTFARNEQLLRTLSYLSDTYILLKENEDGDVDVHIITRDSWSIGLTFRSVPNSRRYLDLYDSNIFGSGNRLDLRTYISYKGRLYGGNMLEYHASNLWGSFFELDVIGGWGYEEHRAGIRLAKEYIKQTDFIAGGVIEDSKHYEQQMMQDTLMLIRHRDFDGWFGKSWDFPAVNSSFYIGGRYRHLTYHDRPEVRQDTNTFYHSRQVALLNTGIYRETYYRGNMIYGYGRTENVPYGHKFEFTGGRYWGEFGDKWYGGFTAAVGRQTKRGYFRAEGSVNTFWNGNGGMQQSALELRLNSFSNLWKVRRSYIRQFFDMRYLQGYNRYTGEGEQVAFFQEDSPRSLIRDGVVGKVRLVMRSETVVFSPIYFYGFRFAFFGFADVGWLGDNRFAFQNDFYTTFGIGVRLKNERLIFNTIQLRLGFAVGKNGLMDYRNFRYSNESRLEVPQFKAGRPELFQFR